MKKTVKKNVKTMSFHQLCEAIEAGDKTILEEFDFDTEAPAEDADFTAEFGGEEDADLDADVDADVDVEDDTEAETEAAPATVSIEIDPNGSLVDALHAILDVLEGDGEEMVEDDMADDAEADGDDLVEDDTTEGDDLVEDDTEGESEDEECEGPGCKDAEEDEELAASAPAAGIHVADKMKETKRTKSTPAVNRKGTADDDLELAPHTEGDAAGTKPTERKKHTPAIDRSATAKSRLTPTKRITNIGK